MLQGVDGLSPREMVMPLPAHHPPTLTYIIAVEYGGRTTLLRADLEDISEEETDEPELLCKAILAPSQAAGLSLNDGGCVKLFAQQGRVVSLVCTAPQLDNIETMPAPARDFPGYSTTRRKWELLASNAELSDGSFLEVLWLAYAGESTAGVPRFESVNRFGNLEVREEHRVVSLTFSLKNRTAMAMRRNLQERIWGESHVACVL